MDKLTRANAQLRELRAQWEAGLRPLSVIENDYEVLVILEDVNAFPDAVDRYWVQRYFRVGGVWQVSVDGKRIELADVFSWLNDPGAISASPQGRIVPTPAEGY
jgi:hypothetical protein